MSGTIYPNSAPRDDPAKSEIRVWKALRDTLPDGWTAWHSLRTRDESRVVYEADFVVASPEFGMLVLEVKGGRLEIRDGAWHRDGQRMTKCPLSQARQAAHCIAKQIRQLGVPCPPFGEAVVLSGTDFSAGPNGGDLAGAVIGQHELPYFDDALRDVAARVVPKGRVPGFERWTEAIHRLWGESWVPTLSTRDRALRAERRILRLNTDQLRLLDIAEKTSRAVVTGGAGTGKTLVARELCQRRAQRGQRVLYLCFTRALGAVMRRDFEEGSGSEPPIRATNVRQLAVDILRHQGKEFDFDRDGAWDEVSLEAAAAAEETGFEPYDLVVVDEAQDLAESDWTLVEVMSRNRDLWALIDPRQHFWRSRSLPSGAFEGAAQLTLLKQHRNPTVIEAFAAQYGADSDSGTHPDALSEAVEGKVRIVVASPDGLLEAVAGEISRWRAAGARPADIAIVTVAGQTKSEIVGRPDLLGEALTSAGSEDANRVVVADTFLRFKGFERPFVVVTELGGDQARPEYDTRMHIALTRATAELVVVCTEADRRQDPRLAPSACVPPHLKKK